MGFVESFFFTSVCVLESLAGIFNLSFQSSPLLLLSLPLL